MKKITTFILLILLAFNWFGYRFVLDYVQSKNDSRMEVLLDNNSYEESQLIELKIPVHLPYQNSWTAYERYDGEVEYQGFYYKYVKRKLCNDTLYLKCISNGRKTKMEVAKNDFFKNTNDINPSNNKHHNSKSVVFKKAISDFDNNLVSINSEMYTTLSATIFTNIHQYFLSNLSIKFSGEPPDLAC